MCIKNLSTSNLNQSEPLVKKNVQQPVTENNAEKVIENKGDSVSIGNLKGIADLNFSFVEHKTLDELVNETFNKLINEKSGPEREKIKSEFKNELNHNDPLAMKIQTFPESQFPAYKYSGESIQKVIDDCETALKNEKESEEAKQAYKDIIDSAKEVLKVRQDFENVIYKKYNIETLEIKDK
jgi:hypothetical protein